MDFYLQWNYSHRKGGWSKRKAEAVSNAARVS